MTDAPSNDASGAARSGSSSSLVARIAAMMFLQYWSLGLWWVTVGNYIAGNTGVEGSGIFSSGFVGYSASAAAIGSLVSPVLVGWISDRLAATNTPLFLLHVLSAAALWWMQYAGSEVAFFVALLLYFQVYAPTVTLTNTIALTKLVDREREFPVMRLFGTVGWIAAGVFVGVISPWWFSVDSIEATLLPIQVALCSHLAMATYSLTLPSLERSKPTEKKSGPPWRVIQLPSVALFLLLSVLVTAATQPYNLANLFLNQTGYRGAAATLTIGQIVELFCLGGMAWIQFRLGLSRLLAIGIACWVVRYVLLMFGSLGGPEGLSAALVLSAIAVHGPAYVFVYLVGQMYVDRLVPPESRGVGQGLYMLATNGVGHLLGAMATGGAQAIFLTPAGVDPPPYDWRMYWLSSAIAGAVAGLVFWGRFGSHQEPSQQDVVDEASTTPLAP